MVYVCRAALLSFAMCYVVMMIVFSDVIKVYPKESHNNAKSK